jgi:hypothetical protein
VAGWFEAKHARTGTAPKASTEAKQSNASATSPKVIRILKLLGASWILGGVASCYPTGEFCLRCDLSATENRGQTLLFCPAKILLTKLDQSSLVDFSLLALVGALIHSLTDYQSVSDRQSQHLLQKWDQGRN